MLPCCHDFATLDAGDLGWLDHALAIDTMRAIRLGQQGYRIWTQTIPAPITPQNRLLIGEPAGGAGGSPASDRSCDGACGPPGELD